MRALADLAPLRLRKVLRQMLQPVGQPLLGRGTIGQRQNLGRGNRVARIVQPAQTGQRSEEHTSELQSLMRISYAVFCLKKKTSTHKTLNRTREKHDVMTT